MITFKQSGDFSKLDRYLKNVSKVSAIDILRRYGQAGVEALKSATPIDTGATAHSWYYEIEQTDNRISINFCNSNIQNGALVAVLIQYGHATNSGSWVEGKDYINPSIKPIFDQIAEDAWREVTRL